MITREQADRLRHFLKSMQSEPPQYFLGGPAYGPWNNCTTFLARGVNQSGAGSYGLLGPWSPRMTPLATSLSRGAPVLRAVPPAIAGPYIEIDVKELKSE